MDETSIGKEEAVFSFITDQKFRTSLAGDYAELLKSLESGAWKAAHVLSGSVVEALLIDFLISMDYEKKSGKNPLELDLSKAVDACRKEGALSDRASALATVIRGYRNLIHPGRMIRLNERVDKNSAAIAKALVDMVISEIADARINKYGFTADQLMLKIEHDSSCAPILPIRAARLSTSIRGTAASYSNWTTAAGSTGGCSRRFTAGISAGCMPARSGMPG